MTADNRCVTAIVVGMTSTGIIDADSGLIDERVILHVRWSSSHFLYVDGKLNGKQGILTGKDDFDS